MMKLTLSLALVALIAIMPVVGLAQAPAPAPSPTARAAPAVPALTAAEAQQALEVLQDPQKREQLITTLRAIAKAAPAPEAPPTPAPSSGTPPAKATPEVTLQPNSLGAQLLVALSHWSAHLAGEGTAALQAMNNLPALWRWCITLETDPEASLTLVIAAGWVALVVGCALILEFAAAWTLRRPRDALSRHLPTGDGNSTRLLRLLPYALMRLLLDLVPVAIFAAAGTLLSGIIPGIDATIRLVVIAVVNAYAACRAVMCVARMLLSPDDKRLRLWRLSDDAARFVVVWARRLVVVAIFGDALVDIALLLGLDQSAHDGFERLIELVLAVMLIVVVIRSRQWVGPSLRGEAAGTARWRGWLAETWTYLAVITIVTFWIGTATGTHGGLSGLYFPGVTIGAIIAARLLTIVVLGTLERLLRIDPETSDKLPGLALRAARYRRPLEILTTTVISLLCAVVLLQLWGVPAFHWFEGGIGSRLVSALATIAVAMIVAIAIWEVSHAVLERQLAAGPSGQARSIRLLTLMPMLRATLLVTIVAIVGLTALSEIGVNIAPLLAGAGIAGIAIGFGAQHLVQDVITGIFVLFENAIQIGDNVTAAGLTGAVEQLSVRTMRLRAGDGAVHIIPFSSVTTISNTNRGLGNAAVSVTVAFQEDTDRVVQVLAEIGGTMREEDDFKSRMLGDLQIFGVDQVRPWGVTIIGQIVCTDTGRWPVQREFNRRVKKRFEELQIVLGGPPAAQA
jgi:moderate conductance mechanosensitive channel